MLTIREQGEVLYTVVERIPVQVMDMFSRGQETAEGDFHHVTMFVFPAVPAGTDLYDPVDLLSTCLQSGRTQRAAV
jgi:hypothetical protein